MAPRVHAKSSVVVDSTSLSLPPTSTLAARSLDACPTLTRSDVTFAEVPKICSFSVRSISRIFS